MFTFKMLGWETGASGRTGCFVFLAYLFCPLQRVAGEKGRPLGPPPPLLFWALTEHLLYASHELRAPFLLDRPASGLHNAHEKVMPGNLFKATWLENCHRQDSSPEILQCCLHRPSTKEDKKEGHTQALSTPFLGM